MNDAEAGERLEIAGPTALWTWLADNHGRGTGLWLTTWKKAADPSRYVSREEVLDALVAHGWIDGRRMALDDARTMQWISPRRQQVWARSYRQRAVRLEAEGRMRAPGRAAVAAARDAGLWTMSDPVDDLTIPPDLAAELARSGARRWFDGAAPSYRRNVLRWLAAARTPPTRAGRAATIAEHAARGAKVPQF